ncbi:MAG: ABC transporter permease [Treponema sp.]|nr:ABC transporter permease [Treponema sp.]
MFSKWILFVSRRFSKVDRQGRSAVTSMLASLGICFGVMTLITVISVMNGFQMSFIDSIMEVSSYHVQVSGFGKDGESLERFREYCIRDDEILSYVPYLEAQSLAVGRNEKQTAALLRAVPSTVRDDDSGFASEVRMWSGNFDLSSPDSIVLGSDLAHALGVRIGGVVNLCALSGGADVDLFSSDRVFTVTGIFRTGFADINSSYAFVNFDDGKRYFGEKAVENLVYGLKIRDKYKDARVVSRLRQEFPNLKVESWKNFNRSFFGALRVEKNMLMVLVFLIFVVVGINIFSGMRRMVFERREEISIMSAFGGRKSQIQSIFVMQGFLTGFFGAVPGLVLGLLLCVRMSDIFMLISKATYYIQLFFVMLASPESGDFVRENSMFMVYAGIPPRVEPGEVLVITVFGMFSSLVASWIASRNVLKMTVAEVMRDE